MTAKTKNVLCILALLLCLCCPAQCAEYIITENQITAMEQELRKLSASREKSLTELAELKSELATARSELTIAKEQLMTLRKELIELEKLSHEQETALTDADLYCRKLEKTQSKKAMTEYSIKVEKNFLQGAGLGRFWRVGNNYIGARCGYDWQENKFDFWVSAML